MGFEACGHQRLQVAVSDSLMTQICVISFLRLQIAVSDSLMTQMCVKSSLEDNEWLDTKMCQIKIRDCNFLVLTHFCVIVDPSMQFPWRLKKWPDGTPLMIPMGFLTSCDIFSNQLSAIINVSMQEIRKHLRSNGPFGKRLTGGSGGGRSSKAAKSSRGDEAGIPPNSVECKCNMRYVRSKAQNWILWRC